MEQDSPHLCRHFPVPQDNAYVIAAAEAAEEALAQGGTAASFRAYDHFLSGPVTGDSVDATVDVVGLDRVRFREAAAAHRHLPEIREDIAMAEQTGHTGAPNFFIQGRQVGGARPYETFQALVDEELARSRHMVAAGIPREVVFDQVLAHSNASKHVSSFARPGEPPQVWIRIISISFGGMGLSPTDRTREQAEALVESLLVRLRSGADFSEVARQYSEGAEAPNGGIFGALRRDSLIKEVEDASFALPVGGLSGVIPSANGFSIVQRYR